MSNPVISVRHLRTVFDGKVIHDDIDLDIASGEVVVLLGGSGSGKTTLMRNIVGLTHPTGGQCYFHEKDLFALPDDDWPAVRQKIAFIFQGGALFDSLTVEENLEFPLLEHTTLSNKERKRKANHILQKLNLGEINKLYPAELSGGMQKRLGIARALMLDPEVVLFDEPTAGLDPANIKRINEIILTLKDQGIASVVVTHDEQCAKAVANTFTFLKGGRIAASQKRQDFRVDPAPELVDYFSGRID